jgi:hypothetical protein
MPKIVGSHTAERVGTLIGQHLKQFLGKDVKPYTGILDGGDWKSIRFTARYI